MVLNICMPPIHALYLTKSSILGVYIDIISREASMDFIYLNKVEQRQSR